MRKSFLLVMVALCLCSYSALSWGAGLLMQGNVVVYQGPPEPPK